jgi:hypothetical protein
MTSVGVSSFFAAAFVVGAPASLVADSTPFSGPSGAGVDDDIVALSGDPSRAL